MSESLPIKTVPQRHKNFRYISMEHLYCCEKQIGWLLVENTGEIVIRLGHHRHGHFVYRGDSRADAHRAVRMFVVRGLRQVREKRREQTANS